MPTLFFFILAAFAEIIGCFSFWLWLRQNQSPWWLAVGVVSLIVFALILALAPASNSAFAGRTYAAYGGIYIACSLLWLWRVEGQIPDRWDFIGAGLCIIAAAIMIFAPRAP